MDLIALRLIFIIGLIALAGLAILAGELISALSARRRAYGDAAARAAASANRRMEEDDSRERAVQLRQMLWGSRL